MAFILRRGRDDILNVLTHTDRPDRRITQTFRFLPDRIVLERFEIGFYEDEVDRIEGEAGLPELLDLGNQLSSSNKVSPGRARDLLMYNAA